MRPLLEIYSKYLTTEKVTKDDPKIDMVKNALEGIIEEYSCNRVLDDIRSRLSDETYNNVGLKKLWKPGLPMVSLERNIFTVDDLTTSFCSLFQLIFSEILEESITDEIEIFRNIYIPYRSSDYRMYLHNYYSYISRFVFYIYKIQNFNNINEKPVIKSVRLDFNNRSIIDINSGSKLEIDNLDGYRLAFSMDMVREQFSFIKKRHMDWISFRIDCLRKDIDRSKEIIKDKEDQINELMDRYLIDDSRLDELLNIEEL